MRYVKRNRNGKPFPECASLDSFNVQLIHAVAVFPRDFEVEHERQSIGHGVGTGKKEEFAILRTVRGAEEVLST